MLKGKTRLLITHSTQYLPDVDHIFVMENGGVLLAQGNLTELKVNFCLFVQTSVFSS